MVVGEAATWAEVELLGEAKFVEARGAVNGAVAEIESGRVRK